MLGKFCSGAHSAMDLRVPTNSCLIIDENPHFLLLNPAIKFHECCRYDQEKLMGERAGDALVADLKVVDRLQHTPADDMA